MPQIRAPPKTEFVPLATKAKTEQGGVPQLQTITSVSSGELFNLVRYTDVEEPLNYLCCALSQLAAASASLSRGPWAARFYVRVLTSCSCCRHRVGPLTVHYRHVRR